MGKHNQKLSKFQDQKSEFQGLIHGSLSILNFNFIIGEKSYTTIQCSRNRLKYNRSSLCLTQHELYKY